MLYEHDYDWDRNRWPEFTLHNQGIGSYTAILLWIYDTIENCERHMRWKVIDVNDIIFKFRYERDYIMFALRWG